MSAIKREPRRLLETIASSWDGSDDPVFSNGYVRATIREVQGGTNLGLGLRISNETLEGYYFTTSYNPRGILLNSCVVDDTLLCEDLITVPVDFTAEEDWIMEAGAVGDLLTAKLWRAGAPEPDQPQLSIHNDDLKLGRLGVIAFHSSSWPASSQIEGSFDDIYFAAVPEPSSLLIAALGVSCLVACRRKEPTVI